MSFEQLCGTFGFMLPSARSLTLQSDDDLQRSAADGVEKYDERDNGFLTYQVQSTEDLSANDEGADQAR